MGHIAIPIPPGNGKQDVEIEITVNGKKAQLHYKVELFYWEDCAIPNDNRVECIRNLISEYDQDWMIYTIGDPNDSYVPITFVKKADWMEQRKLLIPMAS